MEARNRRLVMLIVVAVLNAYSAVPYAFGRPADVRHVPEVNLVRLEGHVGEAQPADKGTTALRLNFRSANYQFQLADLRVLAGSRLPGRILADVAPLRPNFFLRGPDAVVRRLDTATPADRVVITAYLRSDARDLMVTDLTVGAPATPASSPPGDL